MRKGATDSGGTGGMCIDTQDDELLDGVVRTVTTQPTDSRDHSRRRARLFNRKSCMWCLIHFEIPRIISNFSAPHANNPSRPIDGAKQHEQLLRRISEAA